MDSNVRIWPLLVSPIQAEGVAAQPPRNTFSKEPLELLLRVESRLPRYTFAAELDILSLVQP